jgi:hypothetical protein
MHPINASGDSEKTRPKKKSGRRYEKMQQMCLCPNGPLPQHNYHRSYLNALFNSSLCLALLALHVLVCTKGKTSTDEDDCIKTNTQTRRVARRSGRRWHCCNLRFWVSLLKDNDQPLFRIEEGMWIALLCASSFRPADPQESRVPRHCVQHPQKPQLRLVHQHRAELPLHHWIQISSWFSSCLYGI